jgi:hypothetical protein
MSYRLTEMLLKEHSKTQRDEIVNYIGSNPKRFSELIQLMIKGPYRITQRAAWPLSYIVVKHPQLVLPHLTMLMNAASQHTAHNSVKRNVVRLLQFINIPNKLHGYVIDFSLQFLNNSKEPIAVRVFAMTVLANLAQQHPTLKNEVIPLIEAQLPYSSAAFKNRGSKILQQLKEISTQEG